MQHRLAHPDCLRKQRPRPATGRVSITSRSPSAHGYSPKRFRGLFRGRGYALLLTLVMLALTAVAVASLAHTSASDALAARQAERDLQRRWAETGCRRVLMPAMQSRLEDELDRWRYEADRTDPGSAPPSSVSTQITLGGVLLDVRVDDQQALPNLNTLLQTGLGDPALEVQRVVAQAGLQGRLAPSPLDADPARRLGLPAYASWGQVYAQAPPEQLSGMSMDRRTVHRAGAAPQIEFSHKVHPQVIPGGSSRGTSGGWGVLLTLWGDGRLNLWTASGWSVHRVLDERIGADRVADLLALRGQYPDRSSRQLASMLNLPPDQRAAAQLALTDRSRVYAMWLGVTPVVVRRDQVHNPQLAPPGR